MNDEAHHDEPQPSGENNHRTTPPASPPRPGPGPRPQVRSGLANRRNPVLAMLGEISSATGRVLFKDLLTLFLGVASIVLAITFFALLGSIGPSSHGTQIPISRVVTLAEHKKLAAATLLDHDSRVEVVTKANVGAVSGGSGAPPTASDGAPPVAPTGAPPTASNGTPPVAPNTEYWAAYPSSGAQTQQLLQTLAHSGTIVSVNQQSGKAPRAILVQFLLPILLLVCLFALFTRLGADGGASGIAGFSKFTGKGRRGGKGTADRITFNDVAGAGGAVAELREIRDYLSDPSRYLQVGAAARRCSPRRWRVKPTRPSSRSRARTSSSRWWA
jgi:cell division protease FtsH